jgi:hypothetical protein
LGEVGPSVEQIIPSKSLVQSKAQIPQPSSTSIDVSSSSDKKTSSGSMSEGQIVVLESFAMDSQVVESHDDSTSHSRADIDTQDHSIQLQESELQEDHSSSQIHSTSINVSIIEPERK